MTINEFAKKYDIPVQRVKAAMNLKKSVFGTDRYYGIQFPEQEMCENVFSYLMDSFGYHVNMANLDIDQAKRIAKLNSERENEK